MTHGSIVTSRLVTNRRTGPAQTMFSSEQQQTKRSQKTYKFTHNISIDLCLMSSVPILYLLQIFSQTKIKIK